MSDAWRRRGKLTPLLTFLSGVYFGFPSIGGARPPFHQLSSPFFPPKESHDPVSPLLFILLLAVPVNEGCGYTQTSSIPFEVIPTATPTAQWLCARLRSEQHLGCTVREWASSGPSALSGRALQAVIVGRLSEVVSRALDVIS